MVDCSRFNNEGVSGEGFGRTRLDAIKDAVKAVREGGAALCGLNQCGLNESCSYIITGGRLATSAIPTPQGLEWRATIDTSGHCACVTLVPGT